MTSKGLDAFAFDEENDSDQEESFIEIDDDIIQCKEIRPGLINYSTKGRFIVKFSPKVVYRRCVEAKKFGQKYNLTYKFVKNDTKLIRKILEGHGFEQIHSANSLFNLMWTGGGIKPVLFKTLLPFQRVNHFPKSFEVTRKDYLCKNIEKIQQEKGFKHFNFIPTTFILPYQLHDFRTTFEKEKGIWIVKPSASSQGRGIFLINNPEEVPADESLVVSRYIDNPLLIDGYKFDIRIYVAVTSYDPLVIYLYQEGLVRFATVKYDRNPDNLSNTFIHLTNYTLNKRNHRYIRCDDAEIEDFGNKWTMSAMLRLLKSEGKDTFTLMMSIEDIIIKTFISVESQISSACQTFVPNRSNCFEVYGFDILVDDELKPWLLEVNLSPSLACDAPIDLKIKSQMICDLLNMITIPCTDPSTYLNQQRQINDLPSRSRPISAGYALINENSNSGIIRAKTAHNPNKEINDNQYNGLSFEQIRILKKIQQENRQRGGFVRIFPTGDTYEFFSNFFQQRKTSFNKFVHQHLYPSRWTLNSFNSHENLKQIRRNNIPRSKHLSTAFHLSNKNIQNQLNGSDLHHAIQRYQLYEKRLMNNIYSASNIIHPHKIVVEEPVIEHLDQNFSSSSSTSSSVPPLAPPQTRRTTPINSHRIVLNKQQTDHLIKQDMYSKNCLDIPDDEIRERVFFKESSEDDFKKRTLRVSSAPKQPYNRRSIDINRLDGLSRPTTSFIQHAKRVSKSVSSSPSKILSNSNEIDLCSTEELNRDFVEQLNELSSKQHRRQYSGSHYLNTLHNESSVVEQETNITVNNENKTCKEKEVEILEKSRQILEESQIKNKQLAQQAKIFQQKLQKNEIYSALNRYSNRPPVYPASPNKSQQSRSNQRISLFIDQHRVKSSS